MVLGQKNEVIKGWGSAKTALSWSAAACWVERESTVVVEEGRFDSMASTLRKRLTAVFKRCSLQ